MPRRERRQVGERAVGLQPRVGGRQRPGDRRRGERGEQRRTRARQAAVQRRRAPCAARARGGDAARRPPSISADHDARRRLEPQAARGDERGQDDDERDAERAQPTRRARRHGTVTVRAAAPRASRAAGAQRLTAMRGHGAARTARRRPAAAGGEQQRGARSASVGMPLRAAPRSRPAAPGTTAGRRCRRPARRACGVASASRSLGVLGAISGRGAAAEAPAARRRRSRRRRRRRRPSRRRRRRRRRGAASARRSTSRQSVYSSVSVGMFWRALRSSDGRVVALQHPVVGAVAQDLGRAGRVRGRARR